MSRLKHLNIGEEKAMVQKTVRVPADLYSDFEMVLADAKIDSFNLAVVELIRLEVEEWKEEKKKEQRKAQRKEKKDSRKSQRDNSNNNSKDESKEE